MTLRANGKLLLTAEYFVLAGATAIVLPVRFGQQLTVSSNNSSTLEWNSYSNNTLWFSAKFSLPSFTIVSTTSQSVAENLAMLLKTASNLSHNPNALLSKSIRVDADFDLQWGLGSSSTLTSLVAQLLNVDAFTLHQQTSNGSGYDVIAATQNSPFSFQLNSNTHITKPVGLPQALTSNAVFAYLGKKQSSAASIKGLTSNNFSKADIESVSALSNAFMQAQSVAQLVDIIDNHEAIVAKQIGSMPIKQNRFADFNGAVKSLGAWGGDFALFISPLGMEYTKRYIAGHNLNPVFGYDDIGMERG